MTHTPGPWIIQAEIDGPPTMTRVVSYNDCIGSTGPMCGRRYVAISQCEANARLISAAPELLTALRGILKNLDTTSTELGSDAIADARAAITKATGA